MTTRDRMILAVCAVLVVVAAGWFFAVAPKRKEASSLSAEIATAQQDRAAVSHEKSDASAAQRTYAADAAAIAALGKALPSDDQTASLLYQLDSAAGSSHVKLQSITPAATGASVAPTADTSLPAGVTEVDLSLSFDGRYADLERFLRRVRSFTDVKGDRISVRGRLLNIKSLRLDTQSATAGHVTASMDASVYVASATATSSTSGATAATASAATSAAAPPAPSGSTAPPVAAVGGVGG